MTPDLPDSDAAPATGAGRSQPDLGPSDTSDSGSDMPRRGAADEASDSGGTGARPGVEPRPPEEGEDIAADRQVSGSDAGLAVTPPDPERNGGLPPAPTQPGQRRR